MLFLADEDHGNCETGQYINEYIISCVRVADVYKRQVFSITRPHPRRKRSWIRLRNRPTSAGAGNGRNDDNETPPPDPSQCDGVRGGAGPYSTAHGRVGHPQYGGLYAEMCIRDSSPHYLSSYHKLRKRQRFVGIFFPHRVRLVLADGAEALAANIVVGRIGVCLLYTSRCV